MRPFVILLFVGFLLSLSSCRKDFTTVASSGQLEFSKSKIYLDTVFSDIGSSTYMLKVYNRSAKDIAIPKIQLGKGNSSKYRIMVDGMTGIDEDHNGIGDGKIFNNVELLAKDSLFIFIETTVNIAQTEPDLTYNDQILFDVGSNQQRVDLVTLIQDAHFIFPNKPLETGIKETLYIEGIVGVEGHTLTDNELHWTNDKPYVIYGYAAVPTGKTLVIDPGTKVYFHADTYSGLVIANGATLTINGGLNLFDANGNVTTQNEVTFEGDRLEPDFEDTPGQWGTILLFSGSNNTISHLTLKNATIGLYIQTNIVNNTPNLAIENSQFYGCSNYGILAKNAKITGKNLVINSAGQASLVCSQGGNYDFIHCTFNNDWASSKQKAVLVNDYYTEDNITFNSFSTNVRFTNCILYGSNQTELSLEQRGTDFNYKFDHCLIKFNNPQLNGTGLYNFTNIANYDSCYLATSSMIFNPKFKNSSKNQLNIQTGSEAIGKGNALYSSFLDILGKSRSNSSDIGAYEF